ncbi:MAG: hypothetical protein RLZZ597_2324 [Cyanobacteriota bacterium]|jgi:hypothetical protein
MTTVGVHDSVPFDWNSRRLPCTHGVAMIGHYPNHHALKALTAMNPTEFETQYKEDVREILNRLQSAMADSSRIEGSLAEIGDLLQRLSRNVEKFLATQHRTQAD